MRIMQGSRGSARITGVVVVVVIAVVAAVVVRLDGPTDDGSRSADATPPPTTSPTWEPPVRLGLHYTDKELEVWRERARVGPYRTAGDASSNSPGDWERIVANADRFMDDPYGGTYAGPTDDSDGCVDQFAQPEPPEPEASELRDAAFVALVMQDGVVADTVRDRLLHQAQQPGVDFSDRDRWCTDVVYDVNPNFIIASWLTSHLYAYDYLGRESFSPDERQLLDDWFHSFAVLVEYDVHARFTQLFEDRDDGDWDPLEEADREHVPYFDGQPFSVYGRAPNNRVASMIRFVALVGVHQDDEHLQDRAKTFFKEYIQFGVFPAGYTTDFHRWMDDDGANPDRGLSYATNLLAHVITIADVFARAGDTSLYDYSTRDGYGESAADADDEPKTLLYSMRTIARYYDHTYERYATDTADDVGDEDVRIDGRRTDGRDLVSDVNLARANLYYQDPYIASIYARDGSTTIPYPADPINNGRNDPWQGDAGTLSAALFMTGQMEGIVWPPADERVRTPAP